MEENDGGAAAGGPQLPPADQRYFEDYPPGVAYTYGPVEITEAEILQFASLYDPQPMHVDKAAATAGPFGGLIASGWQTAGLMMRLYVDNHLSSVASKVSPGVERLRWLRPVRPGDRLTLRVTTLSATRSRSKPMQGALIVKLEALDAEGQLVCDMQATTFMACRGMEDR
jgi:acyl dehydratase